MTDVLEIFAPYGPGSLFGALLVLVVLYFGKQFLEEFKAQNERKANIDLKREERKQDEVNERAQRDRERSQMEGRIAAQMERSKLKKMARMVADGIMTPEQVEQSYQSWRGGMKRLDAHRSVRAMDALYRSLFGNHAGGVAQCNPNLEATRMGTCPYPSNGRSDP